MSSTVVGVRNTTVNKSDTKLCPHGAYSLNGDRAHSVISAVIREWRLSCNHICHLKKNCYALVEDGIQVLGG